MKKSKKESREHEVLLGLVELYLREGKPVGSNTLREQGFERLSSATIRNYFAELEKQEFLKQPHASGGRVPTEKGFRLYATESLTKQVVAPEIEERLQILRDWETKNVSTYLQNAGELLGEITGCASFLSSVRFDHDFILDIKLVDIDNTRILCVLITDFGQILTEVLAHEGKIGAFALKRIENYFLWRLKGQKADEKPENLTPEEELTAQALYNEIMVRYIVRYSNFSDEDIYRSGFSRLLAYPEFNDPVTLSSGLAIFENSSHMRLLLSDCASGGELRFWIGSDLAPYAAAASSCSVIAMPYKIGQITVGAIGILGPCRMPYRSLFGTLKLFGECVSEALTKTLYKHKLTFRQPRSGTTPYLEKAENKLLEIKE